MRILVIGAGAVGGYFGARLQEAGRDVTFLVRPGRRAQLAASGLAVKSPYGNLSLPARAVLAKEIKEPWDLIIVSCKAYDLANAMDSFAGAVGRDTMILPLLNGMGHLDALTGRFGGEKVLGGTCTIGVTLNADGTIVHFNHLNSIVFGERGGGESGRTRAIAGLFTSTKTDWSLSLDIIQAMWEKWMVLSTLAASTCLFRASTGDIVSAGGADVIGALLDEAGSSAESAGHGAPPETLDAMRRLLTDPASTFTASMLRDMERGGPTEACHVIGDLLGRAQAAGRKTPLLELAYLHLKSYEARRRREAAAETGGGAQNNAKV